MEELTANDKSAICNKLAWTDGSFDEAVINEYGLDGELIEYVMACCDYEWNCELNLWASKRKIWYGWDGKLPTDS